MYRGISEVRVNIRWILKLNYVDEERNTVSGAG